MTSASAIEFFNGLPKVEVLMPPLEMASIEQMLQARSGGRGDRLYELSFHHDYDAT